MKAACLVLACICFLSLAGNCQTQPQTLDKFSFEDTVPPKIVRNAIPANPFTVVSPRGAILGQQDGAFEAWIFPWKIFSNLRITAEMQNYPVPIDVNEQAAVIEVRPDHTMITFSHANFTIREILFAPHKAPDGTGVLAFFEIKAIPRCATYLSPSYTFTNYRIYDTILSSFHESFHDNMKAKK